MIFGAYLLLCNLRMQPTKSWSLRLIGKSPLLDIPVQLFDKIRSINVDVFFEIRVACFIT